MIRIDRALRLLAVFAFLALVAGPARAIPTNPDPIHTAAATPWPLLLPNPFNKAADRHQHWTADPIDGAAGDFATYAVWDDNIYQYGANVPTMGHGYMENPASYTYDLTVPAMAKPLFDTEVVDYWEGEINGPDTNVNGHKTLTKINFGAVPMAGDITIKFDTKYPVIRPNPNPMLPGMIEIQDFPSPGSISPNGTWGGNPGNPGGGPGGGSEGVLAFWTPGLQILTFNSFINWYYLDPVVDPAIGQFDFVTTALHEFGHILGLDHEGLAGDVMFGSSASYVADGMGGVEPFDDSTEVRDLDVGATLGSVILYTIAVPEPTAGIGFSTAALLLLLSRRQNRAA